MEDISWISEPSREIIGSRLLSTGFDVDNLLGYNAKPSKVFMRLSGRAEDDEYASFKSETSRKGLMKSSLAASSRPLRGGT